MFRKTIGSRNRGISEEDSVDMIDDELEEIHMMREQNESDTSDAARREKLSKKAAIVRNRRSDTEMFVSDERATHDVECTCDLCMKSFLRKPDAKFWTCPFCGHKYELEDLEEVDTMSENPYKDMVVSESHLDERRNHFRSIFDKKSETWEDGRKEQISLELGSEEYEEYLDDLQRNDPENPDDKFHAKLEKHNEDMVTKNFDTTDNPEAEKAQRNDIKETSAKIQAREEMQKRDIHAKAVREAIAAAALTETLTDDQLARAITSDNVVLYDKSVKPDEYVDALKEYVTEPSL